MTLHQSYQRLSLSELITCWLDSDACYLLMWYWRPMLCMSFHASLEFQQWLSSWLQNNCLCFKHHVLLALFQTKWKKVGSRKGLLLIYFLCAGEGNLPKKAPCKFLFMCHWSEMCHICNPKPIASKGSVVTVIAWEESWFIHGGWNKERGGKTHGSVVHLFIYLFIVIFFLWLVGLPVPNPVSDLK